MRTFVLSLSALALDAAVPQNAPYAGDSWGGVQGGQYQPGWQGGGGGSGGPVCEGLAGTPQCCQSNALGLAALPCDPPSQQPWDKQSFYQICAASGRSAQCCALPVAGAALLCNQP